MPTSLVGCGVGGGTCEGTLYPIGSDLMLGRVSKVLGGTPCTVGCNDFVLNHFVEIFHHARTTQTHKILHGSDLMLGRVSKVLGGTPCTVGCNDFVLNHFVEIFHHARTTQTHKILHFFTRFA